MLKELLKSHGIALENEQIQQLKKYQEMVLETNEYMNLTSITEEEEFHLKHFLDSLWPEKYVNFSDEKIIDIGTGAGFPAIPLKIHHPQLEMVLLDSLKKRLGFIDGVIEELSLDKIKTIHGRAEEVSRQKDYREQFDIAISRAVARLNTLVEWSLPFVKIGGVFIAMKGSDGLEELKEAEKGIEILGGRVKGIKEYQLEENDHQRTMIIIEKVKSCPKKYPRGGGKPVKKPL
ncbi:MAG: 16S rRNA (guanine(527)-N(7))-methyltransferase RsmG [Tissierellia bacterium]|nr:16S rRNA (guanine(527)-N(7))-methyltransferase RsmG [Tissierellia bacterium]